MKTILKIKILLGDITIWFDGLSKVKKLQWQKKTCMYGMVLLILLLVEYYVEQNNQISSLAVHILLSIFMMIGYIILFFGGIGLYCMTNYLSQSETQRRHQKNKDELENRQSLQERDWLYKDLRFLSKFKLMNKKKQGIKNKIL